MKGICLRLFACGMLQFPAILKAQESVEMDYKYLPSQLAYQLQLKLITRCDASFNLPNIQPVIQIRDYLLDTYTTYVLQIDSGYYIHQSINPCIVAPDTPCYKEIIYQTIVPLTPTIAGYLLIWQGCCRADSNLLIPPLYPGTPYVANYPRGSNGLTLTQRIKVSRTDPTPYNSPVFGHDSVLVFCKDQSFSFLYNATDPEPDDSIRYAFTPLYGFANIPHALPPGAPPGPPPPPDPIIIPPYPPIEFRNAYAASTPLGPDVKIDPLTGLISGTPQDTGIFQLGITAYKYEHGVMVASTKRELEIHIYDCPNLPKAKARLPALINRCNSFDITMPDSSTTDRIYSWDFGDGNSFTGFADSGYAPDHVYAKTGTYPVRLIVNPGYYCADTANSTAIVYPSLNPRFQYLDSCADQTFHFSNISTTTFGTITSNHWDFNDKIDLPDTSDQTNPSFIFSKGDTTYSIYLTSTSSVGCTNTDTQNVSIFNPPPRVILDTTGVLGQSMQLNAGNALDGLQDQLQWTPPEGLNNNVIADPVVMPSQAPLLSYQLQVTNKFGCLRLDSFQIKYYKGPAIYVPNAFTPNGDGRNDLFRPIMAGMLGFHFRVFNRWGNLVFETSRSAEGWNGLFRGNPAPAGTYIWEISATDENHKSLHQNGTVILIR